MRGDCRVALISIAFTVLAGLPALVRLECKDARPADGGEVSNPLFAPLFGPIPVGGKSKD